MRKTPLRFIAASCAFCAIPALAQAQVGQPLPQSGQVITPGQTLTPGQPIGSGQPIRSGQTVPGQTLPGQATPGVGQPQLGSPQRLPGSTQASGNQTYEARRVDPSTGGQQAGAAVEDFLVRKIILANDAEIELGQMAQDKAKHDQVKEYARTVVNDHRQLNEQLKQHQSQSGQTGARGQQGAQGQQGAGQRQGQQGQQAQQRQQTPQGQLSQQDQRQRQGRQDQGQGQAQGQGRQVPQQLTMIVQRAADKKLQMAKEMLQEQEGSDFDMAFVGMQIVGHASAVAELQAIENVGSQEFQELVRTSEAKISNHLEKAKSLAKTLKEEKKN